MTLANTREPAKPLHYVEMPSTPALAGVVATYWGFSIHALPHPAFTHHVWPDGCAGLVISSALDRPPVGVVVGATTKAATVAVHPGEQYWGIRFRPEAGAPCCGRSATTMRDQLLDARHVFGDALESLIASLSTFRDADDAPRAATALDRWLLHTLPPVLPIDALVRAAVDLIVAEDGTRPMSRVATQLAVTPRQLQRRFRAATGLTPKEYAGIRRGRAALKRIAAPDPGSAPAGLSQLAAASGYADQAHLTREMGRLTTFSPAVLAERLDDIAHGRLVD